uniref:Mitotic interactor and substrate of PLK1-like n=1 Tax=Cyprinodon variegatus TaxID=28743 RepID=A0A3Q2EH88_CYPVA
MQGEEGVTVGHNVSLQDRKAPKAMPEEDLDAPESAAEDPQRSQTISISDNENKTENPESADLSWSTFRGTKEGLAESQERSRTSSGVREESKQAYNLCEEGFLRSLQLSVLSLAEYCEEDRFYSLEGEVREWTSEPDTNKDIRESPKTPKVIEPAYQDKYISIHHNSFDICNDKTETPTFQTGDFISCNDRSTLNSPPFADESGEEEEAGTQLTACQQQLDTPELICVGLKSTCSDPEEKDTVLPAGTSVRHQEAVLPQSQSKLCPRGLNQEAVQQVFAQGSPPGSAVAMELTNQGREASQGHVAAVTERSGRVGERTQGENEQIGGVEGQNKTGVENIKSAVRSQNRVLFRYLQAVQKQEPKVDNSCGIPLKPKGDVRMRTDMHDDSQSDSGVSADFQTFRTLSSSMSVDSTGPASAETPIEREIRRAIEREQSLRRSRGLPNQRTSPEYVEVPLRRSLLSQSVTPKWSQNKDREFAGKKMLHEIHEESRREQDLVKIGKIPGFYDKGTASQIKERKQLFETLKIAPGSPMMASLKHKTLSSSSSSSEDLSLSMESQDESGASTPDHTYSERKSMMLNHSQSRIPAKGSDQTILRGSRSSEGTRSQIIILEHSRTIPAKKPHNVRVKTTADPAPETKNIFNSLEKTRGYDGLTKNKKVLVEKEEAASKGNPFFKLRTSANLEKVRQEIEEANEREKELHTLRLSLYGGINNAESPITKEMPAPGKLSNSRREAYEGWQSVDKVSAWQPVLSEEEKIFHPEMRKSPRTPRQKTPLVQLWESGMVYGNNLEDD